ncbi:hypothetical protein [Deinococcus apachensis]|uniref:hypothetical protein n=1 Tax=Deinococcus apachensis TaxID=309886 RepID=UPI00038147BC|nr:hypothetical protein [Deinococcus apachensis]
MKKLLALVALSLTPAWAAQPLSPRASTLFHALLKDTAMRQVKCPGGLGGSGTACATSPRGKAALQARIGKWPRWKQTDPWVKDGASFTSDGKDLYVVSVFKNVSGPGSLLVFTEF